MAQAGGVDFLELPRVHAGTLQDALDEKPFSVLHLLCHGLPGKDGAPSTLAWGDGGQKPVSGPHLAKLLRPYRKHLRLVVLNACGSGDASQDALFLGSIAQEIHKKGIHTVVSSRYLLSVAGAIRLTEHLYDALLREGWSLERALRRARAELFRADETGETHEGDAYGMQIYGYASELVDATEAGEDGQRPVLSTYPFGTPQQPAPLTKPPKQTLQMQVPLDKLIEIQGEQREHVEQILRELGEDPELTIKQPTTDGNNAIEIELSVDATQRLFHAERDGRLAKRLGFAVALLLVLAVTAFAFPRSAEARPIASADAMVDVVPSESPTTTPDDAGRGRKKLSRRLKVGIATGVVIGLSIVGGAVDRYRNHVDPSPVVMHLPSDESSGSPVTDPSYPEFSYYTPPDLPNDTTNKSPDARLRASGQKVGQGRGQVRFARV
jgi:hypothetical protein